MIEQDTPHGRARPVGNRASEDESFHGRNSGKKLGCYRNQCAGAGQRLKDREHCLKSHEIHGNKRLYPMTVESDAYRDAMNYLYGRLNYERVGLPRGSAGLGLGRMRRLMRRLGDPQLNMNIIHVAGTKGKGSTSTLIAAGLSAAGYRTGLFCSPHLHRLEERYVIDGQQISPDELIGLVDRLRPVVDAMEEGRPDQEKLTFFEITTALGLLYFADRACDAVVLEVGMGGRLDSTNIVRPLVSVITSISLDHTRQLGNTTAAIAREKAGIIKRGGLTVSGVTDIPARNEIRDVATLRGSLLLEIHKDFNFREIPPEPPLTEPTFSQVEVKTWACDWGRLGVPLLGPHQAENAALALAVLDACDIGGLPVSADDVRRGWSGVAMHARVEVVGRRPLTVVDGAHNKASAEALAATLSRHFPDCEGKRVLVFGTTREKDLEGQLQALLPVVDEVIVTRYLHNPRSRPMDETCQAVERLGGRIAAVEEDPAQALEQARRLAGKAGQVVVTGSLFLAAEAIEILRKDCTETKLNESGD